MTPRDTQDRAPAALLSRIQEQCETPVDEEISILVEKIHSLFPSSLKAIVLYGSCLRNLDYTDGVVDLYVIVDNYKNAYRNIRSRWMNYFLPPSVYYVEVNHKELTLRTKYAVISLEDLHEGIENRFHSYLWSRFAQPVRLVYIDNEETKSHLYDLFAGSVIRYLDKTIPALGHVRVNSEQIWINALSLSYAAELRPERHDRAGLITTQSIYDLDTLTRAAVPALTSILDLDTNGDFNVHTGKTSQRKCLLLWRIRRWQGRILSLCRLIKAVFTFKDAVNYAAWKIKRHTGVTIEVTPVLQRHPILFGITILWRLLRRDALH